MEVDATDLFSDQWLYIHAPEAGVGRITNFRNWVPQLYGDAKSTILAMEYWCYDQDALWTEDDEALIARAPQDLGNIGLTRGAAVLNGHVERVRRCYPVYARGYRDALVPVVDHLRRIPNLWPIGRYGSFKYNNQDHSILMGLLVADNIADGAGHDLWSVNTDYETYQEAAPEDS